MDAVIQAGGIPFLLPFTKDIQIVQSALCLVDGLLLTGGGDVSASVYGEIPLSECGISCEERDVFDYALLRIASEWQIPILGICRGMQVINTFFGGTLYQDLPTQCPSGVCHRSNDSATCSQHSIQCLRDGRLYSIVGKERLIVSSIHHQAVKKIAEGFKVTAFADDGTIEAIESVSRRNIWGVQFHPELQVMENNEDMKKIIRSFVCQTKNRV